MKLFTSYIRELFVQFLKPKSNNKNKELNRREGAENGLSYLKPYTSCLITLKILFCVCLAHAGQPRVLGAATGVALSTDSIKPLQIGDTIPEALWNLPLQMAKPGQKGSTTVTLKDYKGKLIILDFWATWCGPCVASMPKLDSLQKKFVNNLVVLPNTKESVQQVLPFLAQKSIQLPSVVNARLLDKWFPHRTIPHQVWIKDGKVKSVTRASSATPKNIITMLKQGDVRMLQKNDVPLPDKLGEDTTDAAIYRSELTYRSAKHKSGVHIDSNRMAIYNVPAAYLFVEALYKRGAALRKKQQADN